MVLKMVKANSNLPLIHCGREPKRPELSCPGVLKSHAVRKVSGSASCAEPAMANTYLDGEFDDQQSTNVCDKCGRGV